MPHLVNIQFRKKTTIQNIWIYADYKADESYTPSRYDYKVTFYGLIMPLLILLFMLCSISIRAGTNFSDLQEVEVVDLNEPSGWVAIPLKDSQER